MSDIRLSQMDVENLEYIRNNVKSFLQDVAMRYVGRCQSYRLLDIAPQDHEGARPYFPNHVEVDTLDINPSSQCTFIADICMNNCQLIPDNSYDFVVCTEVLEHTLRPFSATQELFRLLKPEGLLFVSVPFNFRIHGPLPDCWRFTEHGLRELLVDFNLLSLQELKTPGRPLMPVHYTVVAQKPKREQ